MPRRSAGLWIQATSRNFLEECRLNNAGKGRVRYATGEYVVVDPA